LLSSGDHETEIERIHAVEAEMSFDLSQGPLLRFKLLKLSAAEHVLLITIHHIICDGWSIGLLHREIAALYAPSGELPKLSIQYADFAIWQRRRLQGEILERQLDYWKEKLADVPTSLDLPTDFPRPATRNMNGARVSVKLPEELGNSLKDLSQREGTTLFMTLLAAFQALLYRYTRQEDVVVGSPVAGRSMLETEDLIGAFVNTLVFRGDLSGNPTFREFLARTRETVLGAFSHQELPFEKLVEELNPERKIDRSPLFQVMFAMQSAPEPKLAVEGLKLTPLKLPSATSKFDLSLEVEAAIDELRVSLEYNRGLFAPETIERMLEHFQNLLATVVADPAQHIAELPLLSDAEHHRLLIEWNDTRVEFPEAICLHQLFEAQAARTPDALAAEFQGERLTYRELNSRANRLAHYLQKRGVGPEVLVGICVERSLEMLVGILGVLKAGGAYVPLDPNYPRDRIGFMIDDALLGLVLTQQRLAKDIPSGQARPIFIDQDWERIAKESEENSEVPVAAPNLAYVIYTSGSTGNPKGVMIEHRQIVNFTLAATRAYAIKGEDRILQFASLSFDLSAEEIFPALTCGATIVLRTDAMISSARDFLRTCDEWKISVLDLPTAYWHDLTDALSAEKLKLPASIRLVIIGGEKALPERVRTWKRAVGDAVRLVNSYGPTETTVVVTLCDVSDDESAAMNTVLIGRPVANTTAYVLDQFLQPVPIGVAGELHLGGAGVTRGYIKRPELSAEKFIANPFSDVEGEKLYKTGDLVRYRADGNLEFLGRVDNQIKIRGFRVELEEIEEALRCHVGVSDCVVTLREDTDGDKRLVGYVVAAKESVAISELRNSLKAKLPSYMVPAVFEMIESLPLMPNGKIDRRALPEPKATRPEPDELFVPPRTPLEAMLADAWQGVLKIDQIGIHENFFDLGGHSLLAAKVVSTVRSVLDIELCMVDVFEAPTIAGLAMLLNARGAQNDAQRELLTLLEELESLTEEAAHARFASETLLDEALVA
jgi:amino acid adenylation domain-containing protein